MTSRHITESIRGNQLSATIRLRRTWAVMMGAGDTAEFREAFAFLRAIWLGFDLVVKVGMLFAMAYFIWKIGPAFLPGGSAYKALEGLK